jgi:molecular chaperone DnaK
MNDSLQTRTLLRRASDISLVMGIDLGTTNSLLAVARPHDVAQNLRGVGPDDQVEETRTFIPIELLKLPQVNLNGTVSEHVLFPSVVYQPASQGERFIGFGAREAKFTERRGHTVFYSVKMDLGIGRQPFYPNAVSKELDDPVKVTSVILRAMKQAAEEVLSTSLDGVPIIITVPASFSSPQRLATRQAALAAGFEIGDDALFDEPAAALLGYINRRRIPLRWNPQETVMVFDFGGGTCDITIVDVALRPSNDAVTLKMLAISRFAQLGGDDIDRRLVHTFVKQEFYRISGRSERDWGFGERQHRIWSQLAKIAELLKVRYCQELDKVAHASNWDEVKMKEVAVSLPPQQISTSQGDIILQDLSLTWERFYTAMAPFLDINSRQDADMMYYRQTSLFTPIWDALGKADLKPHDITRILLAGGSSHNPLVEQAIQGFFPEATIDRPHAMEQLVAEGAVVHAFNRYVLGHDVMQPIVGDSLGLVTEGGDFVPLIPAGASIPFPSAGSLMTYTQFRVPRERMSHVDLVICAGSAARPVHLVQLRFDRMIRVGAPIHLQVGMDSDKVLVLRAFMPEYPDVAVHTLLENPLGLLPMTSTERRRLELESLLAKATAEKTLDQYIEAMVQLADVLLDLRRSEQALQWLDQADRRRGVPDDVSQQLRAYAHYQLGEFPTAFAIYKQFSDRNVATWSWAYMASICAENIDEREYYMRRAVQAAPGSGFVHYGLAAVLSVRGDYAGARKSLDRARDLLEAEQKHAQNQRQVLSTLASVYDALGESAKAEHTRQQALAFTGSGDFTTDNLVGVGHPLIAR